MSTGSLFDSLFNVNRPQLNAYVAQGQSMTGLRTAQTQEALANAQHAVDENDANEQLEGNLTSLFSASGDPLAQQKGKAAANMMITQHGGPLQAIGALGELQKNGMLAQVADPNTPDANRLALLQAVSQKGDVGQSQNFGNQIVNATQPGAPPVVTQTPMSTAEIGQKNAQANLENAQATNPAAFHAGGGAPLDPDAVAFGAYSLFKTNHMPPMGMGNGPMRTAILSGAAHLANQEAQGQNVANPGFDQAIANGQDYTTGTRALAQFGSGTLGNQTRSLNNIVGHLSLYDQLSQQLGNGSFRPGNALDVAFQRMFGSPAPTNMQAAATLIGPELTKLMAGSNAGSAEERTQFGTQVAGLSSAPQQLGGAINTLRGMLGRQGADLALQYHGATSRNDFASRYLQPDVAKYLNLDANSGAAASPPAGGQISEGSTAINPQTQQRIIFRGGQWQPLQQ